jgi:hypothetical protein
MSNDDGLRVAAERSLREGSGRLVLVSPKDPPRIVQRFGGEWRMPGFGVVQVRGGERGRWIIDAEARDVLAWLDAGAKRGARKARKGGGDG